MIDSPAILIDTTRCVGCEECVAACKEENGLGKDRPWQGQGAIDSLSATRNCTVHRRPGGHFVLQQCRHCEEPACVSACLVGAMQKSPEGPVIYDSNRCMGCRYCMLACPYGIPRYDWDKATPLVHKCTMCHHRLIEGGIPACVEACPQEATVFGSRSDLLAEADRRIAADPETYIDRIFGEHEVGGTSVLYVSDIPLDFLSWKPDLGTEALPDLTWQSLSKVPPVILGMGAFMGGAYWVINRRMKLASLAGDGGTTVVDDPAIPASDEEAGDETSMTPDETPMTPEDEETNA